MIPGGLEMMDNLAIRAAEDFIHAGYPVDAQAILLCELDGSPTDVDEDAERVAALLRDAGATEIRVARDEAERQRFWAGRKNAFPAVGRMSPDYYCMDGTIPRRELPRVLEGIAALSAEYGLPVANVFHAGDGNMHPLILFDANRPGELDRAEALGGKILELCVAAGGSITGEHGVGREKINQMCVQFNADEITFFHAVKAAFDPQAAQSRQEHSDAAPLRRIRRDARPSRQAAVFRTGALLMRREIESIDDSAALVAQVDAAIHDRQPLHIRGAGTKAFLGRPVEGRTLDVRTLDVRTHRGIVSYDLTELVVTARAGTPLAELEAMLDAAGQMLPCEPPTFGGAATVGGMFAAALSARAARGPARCATSCSAAA